MTIFVIRTLHIHFMNYTIENEIGNIALICTGDKYYIARVDRVGKFFCRVAHPLVAGKALISSMDVHGLLKLLRFYLNLPLKSYLRELYW